ncbi:MAG TPA: 2-amino-4-hydroxy-6-hydroxymethyldihydropteridine diphosphokinase, partial [Marmoricola sp.]|nr:2-amino-4-hydroxy-6-hydroxymethyldihydropteridine diphosphokinase [Marmoricola sp.]HNJ79292.1 2-amino-4-hydroxy-6-hydroxymethyldihydropteridine diphosphokinase [Marmoricola sp.]
MTETPNPHAINADTLTGEMQPIRRAVLAIGSNLGERFANLQGAVNSLADTPDVWITEVSAIYETAPVESPEDAKDYFNAVVLIDTTLSSRTLLERCLAIETAFGRERDPKVRNAPRTLDVDLIVVGERRINDPDFVLPHPRAGERAFVLQPWFDLEPDAEIPGVGAIRDLLEQSDRSGVHKLSGLELETPGS